MSSIEKLAKSPVQIDVMLNGFSQGVTHAVGARATVIWGIKAGQLSLRRSFPESVQDFEIIPHAWHTRLIWQSCVVTGEELEPATTEEVADAETGVKTLLILCPFACLAIPNGVVEVFQRPDTPPVARPGFQAFLSQAVRILKNSVALNKSD